MKFLLTISISIGNVARTFFANYKVAAECTEVNEKVIEKLYVVLQVLTGSSRPRDINKFRIYGRQTAELCIAKYGWYPMPPSVDKSLIHGAYIMKSFVLPLGWYSEEAQENNNKTFRKARAENSRIMSRAQTNEDTFKYLMSNSDPFIYVLRIVYENKHAEKTK